MEWLWLVSIYIYIWGMGCSYQNELKEWRVQTTVCDGGYYTQRDREWESACDSDDNCDSDDDDEVVVCKVDCLIMKITKQNTDYLMIWKRNRINMRND